MRGGGGKAYEREMRKGREGGRAREGYFGDHF